MLIPAFSISRSRVEEYLVSLYLDTSRITEQESSFLAIHAFNAAMTCKTGLAEMHKELQLQCWVGERLVWVRSSRTSDGPYDSCRRRRNETRRVQPRRGDHPYPS